MNGNALTFFARAFYGEKKHFNLHYPQKGKKKNIKIAEEENGLEPERVNARHLDLRLTPQSNAPFTLSRCQTLIFKALTFHAVIGYFSIELFCFCRIVLFVKK